MYECEGYDAVSKKILVSPPGQRMAISTTSSH